MINKQEKRLVGIIWFTTGIKRIVDRSNIELKEYMIFSDTNNVDIVKSVH